MTSHQHDDRELQIALNTLLSFYETALSELGSISVDSDQQSTPAELQRILQLIEANDDAYKTVVARWNAKTRSHTAQNKLLREKVELSLSKLIQQISLLEQKAATTRDRLLPQLDDAALAHQATTAYRKSATY